MFYAYTNSGDATTYDESGLVASIASVNTQAQQASLSEGTLDAANLFAAEEGAVLEDNVAQQAVVEKPTLTDSQLEKASTAVAATNKTGGVTSGNTLSSSNDASKRAVGSFESPKSMQLVKTNKASVPSSEIGAIAKGMAPSFAADARIVDAKIAARVPAETGAAIDNLSSIGKMQSSLSAAGLKNSLSSAQGLIGESASAETSMLTAMVPKPTVLEYEAEAATIGDYSEGVIGCKTKRKRNSTWHLELLVSPDIAMRSLDSKSELSDNHLIQRDSTENFSNAYTTAARMTYVAESGVMLRTGLQFSQITERLDFTNEQEASVIVISGNDTIVQSSLVPRNRITWNRYKHIDIPLILGYEMGDGPWRFNVNGGVYVNVESWQRGQFMSPDSLDLVNFTTAEPGSYEAFRRNVGLSLYGSVGASYQFADKMQLLIEPHYRHFLKSHTIEEYALDQRYKSLGIFVGVRFTL